MKRRYIDTIRLLEAWAPLTAEWVYLASRSFEKPFTSRQRCRAELQEMHRARLLGRAPIPDTGRGQRQFAYHLRRGAASLVEEVADIPRSNAVFHPLSQNPWHALAIGEFWALFEASAAEHPEIKILERMRDRQFVALIKGHTKLVPDGAVLVEVGGRRKLVFLELVHETSVINPGAEASRRRSLAGKLDKYRAFRATCKSHPTWSHLKKVYGPIDGFQVLLVTTRSNRQYLMTAAEGSRTMFLFAALDELRQQSCLFEAPVWWLPRSAWRPQGPEQAQLLDLIRLFI